MYTSLSIWDEEKFLKMACLGAPLAPCFVEEDPNQPPFAFESLSRVSLCASS